MVFSVIYYREKWYNTFDKSVFHIDNNILKQDCLFFSWFSLGQFNGHWEKGSPVVLCGAVGRDPSLAECASLSSQHSVVGRTDCPGFWTASSPQVRETPSHLLVNVTQAMNAHWHSYFFSLLYFRHLFRRFDLLTWRRSPSVTSNTLIGSSA